uniref:Uncharacterized protein n=1 Tax=Arundo donax TaxID=35708 RepID=A0A0A8ZK50_ARUDO
MPSIWCIQTLDEDRFKGTN